MARNPLNGSLSEVKTITSILHVPRMSNNSTAMIHHGAAAEHGHRAASTEEVSDAINVNVGYTDFGVSLKIEGTRMMKKFMTTETINCRTVRHLWRSVLSCHSCA